MERCSGKKSREEPCVKPLSVRVTCPPSYTMEVLTIPRLSDPILSQLS